MNSLTSRLALLALPLLASVASAQSVKLRGNVEDGEGACYYCPGCDFVIDIADFPITSSVYDLQAFMGMHMIFLAPALAAPPYTITDLGSLGGGETLPAGLSNNTIVVGESYTATTGPHAMLWSAGIMIDLGMLPGDSGSRAYAVNNVSTAVGTSYHSFFGTFAPVRWFAGAMTDLTFVAPGWILREAKSINKRGQITGWGFNASGQWRAYILSGGSAVDLGTLGGATSSGISINDSGVVAGNSDTTSGYQHAFIHKSGLMMDLLPISGHTTSLAVDLNSRNIVVGDSLSLGPYVAQAVKWSRGTPTALPIPPGAIQTHALGINSCNTTVGYAETSAGYRALIWNGTSVRDLNTLVPASPWTLVQAVDINRRGEIVCLGVDVFTNVFALLLKPVRPCICP